MSTAGAGPRGSAPALPAEPALEAKAGARRRARDRCSRSRPRPTRTGSTCPRASSSASSSSRRRCCRSTSASRAGRCSRPSSSASTTSASSSASPRSPAALRNTIVYAVVTSGLKVVIGLLLATLLTSRIRLRSAAPVDRLLPGARQHRRRGHHVRRADAPVERAHQPARSRRSASTGPRWLTDPSLALLSVAFVDVWKGVGHRARDLHRGDPVDPRGVLRGRPARGRRLGQVPARDPAAQPERDVHGDPAVVHRRAADVRPDLDDDPRRARVSPRTSSRRRSTSSTRPGFYGLATAGNVILFIAVTLIVFPMMRFFNRHEIEL